MTRHRAEQFYYSVFPVVLPLVSGFIIHLLMAKSISPRDYAIIPRALAWVSFATTIAYAINHDVAAREIAIAKDPPRTTAAFFMGRIIFALFGAAACAISVAIWSGQDIKVIALFLLWFAANIGLTENLGQIWRFSDQYKKASLLYLLNFLLLLAGMTYLHYHQASPGRLAGTMLLSTVAAAAFFLRTAAAHLKPPDFAILKDILKKSFPVALAGTALYVSNWFGVVYLAAAGANDDLTHYFLAGKFAGAHLILLSILYFAYIPVLSKADGSKLGRLFKKGLWVIGLYAVLSSLVVLFLLLPLVTRFWGQQYLNVRIYYLYYIPWILFACISYYLGIFIYAKGQVSIIGKFQIILAILTAFNIVIGYSKWGPLTLPLAEGLAMLISGIYQFVSWQRLKLT